MAGARAKGGKKNRKIGRNAAYCKTYKAEDRETRNKRRRLRRHLRQLRHSRDYCALSAFTKSGGTDDYLNSLQRAG